MPRPTLDAYKLGSEILVNTTAAGNQDAPAITSLHNGGFVVTWVDASATGGEPPGFGPVCCSGCRSR